MNSLSPTKDFNESHINHFDQILVVDGSTNLKAIYDEATHIITTPGQVHTAIILNAFDDLYGQFLIHAKEADIDNCGAFSREHIYNKTINPHLEQHSLDRNFRKPALRVWTSKRISALHIDRNLFDEEPFAVSLNIKGQGTGIDTRNTQDTLYFTAAHTKNRLFKTKSVKSQWNLKPTIDQLDTQHCRYAPPNSICIIREESKEANEDMPPSPHISGGGKRITGLHLNSQ